MFLYNLANMVLGGVALVGAGVVAAAFWFRKRLERRWGAHESNDEEDVEGKIVIITGANTGLGEETAYELARRGATVIMACRDQQRTGKAIQAIRRRTNRGELIFMKLDLASMDSIREFCKNFNEKYDKIHILVNNAGVFVPLKDRKKTQDGFEINLGVNHLGHFLLTNLLLDKIHSGAPNRIVVVASTLSERGKINVDDLMLETVNTDDIMFAYGTSKLANILFARELARRLSGTQTHIYALCPGWVKTELGRNVDMPWYKYIPFLVVAFMLMRSTHQGVQTILHCCLSKKVTDETGKLYRNCDHWITTSNISDDLAKKLWDASEKSVALRTSN